MTRIFSMPFFFQIIEPNSFAFIFCCSNHCLSEVPIPSCSNVGTWPLPVVPGGEVHPRKLGRLRGWNDLGGTINSWKNRWPFFMSVKIFSQFQVSEHNSSVWTTWLKTFCSKSSSAAGEISRHRADLRRDTQLAARGEVGGCCGWCQKVYQAAQLTRCFRLTAFLIWNNKIYEKGHG